MINIEKLETLPSREARRESLTRRYGDMWNTRFDHSWMRSTNDQYPYVKAERIIKKYLGKSFDKAFSEYCKKVKLHEQKEFLDFFDENHWRNDYIIDAQKRIQLNLEKTPRYKKPIYFRSFDYQEGYYNIVTKEIVQSSRWWEYKNNNNIRVVIRGFERTFESRKDPEYQRLQAEKVKAQKRNDRLLKDQKKAKAYCFLTNSELEKKKLAETDIATRDRHGFDETAFKGIEYHGQKRKLKQAA